VTAEIDWSLHSEKIHLNAVLEELEAGRVLVATDKGLVRGGILD
jgi:hypothetical protein